MRKGSTSLREKNPAAADMWAYDLNDPDMNPENVAFSSTNEAYFRCLKNKKHVFKIKITRLSSHRDGTNTGCIYCGRAPKVAFPGETDLFTVCPSAKIMWDYEKNVDLNPLETLPNSSKKAYFNCDKGHSVLRTVINFTHSSRCPECLKDSVKMINVHPGTIEFWRTNKNSKLDLQTEISCSHHRAYFKCPRCQYEWTWKLETWHSHAFCPCCGFDGSEGSEDKNRAAVIKNNIKTVRMAFPEIEKYWDYTKNGDMTPDSETAGSGKNAWLICPNNHSFELSIYSITSSKALVCPFCKRRRYKVNIGINDLFTVCPEASDMWDYDLNQSLNPKELLGNISVTANFICPQGHRFSKLLKNFARTPKCPECLAIQENNFAKQYPEKLKYWDYEVMPKSPDMVLSRSTEVGYWKCPSCRYTWEQTFESRTRSKINQCPNCEIGRKPGTFKTFADVNPEAAKYWIGELNNGLDPTIITHSSTRLVYLRCPNDKSHVFQRPVQSISNKSPFGCPLCSNGSRRSVVKGKTDVFTLNPKVKELWDWDKNKNIDPYSLHLRARVKIHCICQNGHYFQKKICDLTAETDCPKCRREECKFIDSYPHVLKHWDYTKNMDTNIHTTLAMSKKHVWWLCPKCGYEWQAEIKSRRDSKGQCPRCETRIVVSKDVTDLFTLAPAVKVFLDSDDIDDVISMSSRKILNWHCPQCGYKWQGSPISRVTKRTRHNAKCCPFCQYNPATRLEEYDATKANARIIYGLRYPDLVPKFLTELNGCSLIDVNNLVQLNKKYWWKCDVCHRKFETLVGTMVRSRNTKSHGCPYCSSDKVIRSESFAALHPEVMDEYDPDNTVDPYTVVEGSMRRVRWICRNNSNHKWEIEFGKRAKGVGNCAECRGWHYGRKLIQVHPEFEEYFDKAKNKRSFDSYSYKSNEDVWWHCDAGHSFQMMANNYSVKGEFYCPLCTGSRIVVGINTVSDLKPGLVPEWSPNNEKDINEYFAASKIDVIWQCLKCHGEYLAALADRHENDDYCPYCTNKRPLLGLNTIDDIKPKLAQQWGKNNEHKSSYFLCSSPFRALWDCPDCGNEYARAICDREFDDDNCPYCHNRKALAGFNTIQDINPELMSEWSPHNEKAPDDFVHTSGLYALWICPTCHGEYPAAIKDREINDDSCPYCSNRKPLLGFNTVLDVAPELAVEWSARNTETAAEYVYTSAYGVYWNCSVCHGEYLDAIKNHKLGSNNCPYCNNRRVLVGFNSFAVNHSDLLEYWDYVNNSFLIDPDKILDKSIIPVWWFCQENHKHKYRMSPKQLLYYRKRHMKSCPYCKGRRRKKRHFI